jgi:hypothetical protein
MQQILVELAWALVLTALCLAILFLTDGYVEVFRPWPGM